MGLTSKHSILTVAAQQTDDSFNSHLASSDMVLHLDVDSFDRLLQPAIGIAAYFGRIEAGHVELAQVSSLLFGLVSLEMPSVTVTQLEVKG